MDGGSVNVVKQVEEDSSTLAGDLLAARNVVERWKPMVVGEEITTPLGAQLGKSMLVFEGGKGDFS